MAESAANPREGAGAAQVAQGRGGGGGGRHRGGNRRGNNNSNSNDDSRSSLGGRSSYTKFDGREPTLKGHVYDLSTEKNNEQYVKTTKEVMNWVGREYTKHTGELVQAVSTLQLAAPVAPANPPANDAVAFELWKIEVKRHADRIEAHEELPSQAVCSGVGTVH